MNWYMERMCVRETGRAFDACKKGGDEDGVEGVVGEAAETELGKGYESGRSMEG